MILKSILPTPLCPLLSHCCFSHTSGISGIQTNPSRSYQWWPRAHAVSHHCGMPAGAAAAHRDAFSAVLEEVVQTALCLRSLFLCGQQWVPRGWQTQACFLKEGLVFSQANCLMKTPRMAHQGSRGSFCSVTPHSARQVFPPHPFKGRQHRAEISTSPRFCEK